MAINCKVAEESGNLFFAHLVGVTLIMEENSPREIVSQARLQVTFSPRTLKIFLTMRCVASIETAFPVYHSRGARLLVDVISLALWAFTRAGSLLVSPT